MPVMIDRRDYWRLAVIGEPLRQPALSHHIGRDQFE
jgi:hypothetical protein